MKQFKIGIEIGIGDKVMSIYGREAKETAWPEKLYVNHIGRVVTTYKHSAEVKFDDDIIFRFHKNFLIKLDPIKCPKYLEQ